jgi:Tfp pilus assembly protein FimT
MEAIAALTIAALGIGVTGPLVSTMLRSWKLSCAARDLAMDLQRTRMEAVAKGAYVGIRFDLSSGRDRWRLYLDGGTRGIRSAEIASGVDAPMSDTFDLASRYPGVRFGIARSGAARIPPASGTLLPSSDPIALGGTDIFSCSPTGESSSGTLYLTDGNDMRAVTIYGATGRIRIWSHEGRTGLWHS